MFLDHLSHSGYLRFWFVRIACWAISKDWPFASSSRLSVSASMRVGDSDALLLRGSWGPASSTMKDDEPSFLVRFRDAGHA